jgi:predicted ferric reductase
MTSTVAPVRHRARRAPHARRSPAPGWWAEACGLLVALSLLVVTALWLRGGGATAGGWAVVASAGRLTGLYAADLLLLQVLQMARIPFVERTLGPDTLARWHRWTGTTSFVLMVAHVPLITLGYAGPWHVNPVEQFADLVVDYPGMVMALLGLTALVVVVVSSVRRARRRLRYESWHLLHLYAYLGVGLALPHQLWTGADFVADPVARVYWTSLYLATAGAAVTYRLVRPLVRSRRHRLRVSHTVAEGPGLTSVYLRGRRLDELGIAAGQFFQWRFLDGPGWSRAHPYSLSAPPQRSLLRITVREVGDGSARVARLRPGTKVLIEGPYGRLTGDAYRGGPVTMFACGVGITPLLALLGDLPYAPGEATLVHRVRTGEGLAFAAELARLAADRGVRVVTVPGRRAERPSWLPVAFAGLDDAEAMRRIAPDIAGHHVYVCGPGAWTEAVRVAARAAGVPGGRLHTEQF